MLNKIKKIINKKTNKNQNKIKELQNYFYKKYGIKVQIDIDFHNYHDGLSTSEINNLAKKIKNKEKENIELTYKEGFVQLEDDYNNCIYLFY